MAFGDHIEAMDRAAQNHLGGVSVVYRPSVGESITITGIFDRNHVVQSPGKAGVEQVVPAVFLRLEDLPEHPDEDEPCIHISGVDYIVRGREVDGIGGGITLHLRRVRG